MIFIVYDVLHFTSSYALYNYYVTNKETLIFLKSKKSNWPHLTMTMFFTFKMKPCEKNNSLWQWLQQSSYKYISLPEDLQIQILIFPTMSPDSETSETPQTETTEPTQPEPQTPDQTDPNPPEKNSVTSKVRTLRSVQKTSKNTLFVKLHPLCVWLRRSLVFYLFCRAMWSVWIKYRCNTNTMCCWN